MFFYYLQLDFIRKVATQKIIKQKPLFFSEYLIKQAVILAIKHRAKDQKHLWIQGKILTVAKKIQKTKPILSLLLNAFFNPLSAVKKLEKQYKKNQENQHLALWLALLNEVIGDKIRAELFWDKVNVKNLSQHLRPYYMTHLAKKALENGDLEYASQNLYQAAKKFHQQQSFYEEAETYLLLGTVYRISFISDVAEMLFLSARKLCKNLKWQEGEAKTYANLGMLMVGQERFSEAQNYFAKAEEIYRTTQQHIELAEIYNQQALLFLLMKEHKKAQNLTQKAGKIHQAQNNLTGYAFSQDIAANISWQQNNYTKTIKQASLAAAKYHQCAQISGELDCLYLQAQALYKIGDDSTSEKILRQILEIGKIDCGCFYLANAYNLLGIIYVKRKDLARAKGLFQQSLDLEQRGHRVNALAADYANIGLLEQYCGHSDLARKNLQTALDFAKEVEDEELCICLQNHLDRLSN